MVALLNVALGTDAYNWFLQADVSGLWGTTEEKLQESRGELYTLVRWTVCFQISAAGEFYLVLGIRQ